MPSSIISSDFSVFRGCLCDYKTTLIIVVVFLILRQTNTGISPTISNNNTTATAVRQAPRVHTWANAAFNFLLRLKCKKAFFTSRKQCRHLGRRLKNQMNIYVANPLNSGRYQVVLPAERLTKTKYRSGVVVVDPYPEASFGHIVLVFYVDINVDRRKCVKRRGILLGNGDCLSLALKKRCKNISEMQRSRRRHFARKCEITFLPFVQVRGRGSVYSKRRENRLVCRNDIPGFAPCPLLRPRSESTHLICNPMRDNNHRCLSTQERIHTSCRMFERCDHAVLVSGGWNRHVSRPRHKRNVLDMYELLRRNGFLRRNIKMFFANGLYESKLRGVVHPAAMKLALRTHIRKLCSVNNCVDTLVLYLNSPSTHAGTQLLWDVNSDGMAEAPEMYTLNELKNDLSKCLAAQIHLVVDQSYAGVIGEAFHASRVHRNVIAFTSSKRNEYSHYSEFTRHWTTQNHREQCSTRVHQKSFATIKHSTPEQREGRPGCIRATIFGAPCGVIPPYTDHELRQNYRGCQSLPRALWVAKGIWNQRCMSTRR